MTPTPAMLEAGNRISLAFINRRWVLLVPYAVLLLIFGVLSGYALFKMSKIRIKGDATSTVIVVFMILAILILIGTLAYGLTIDWGKKIF